MPSFQMDQPPVVAARGDAEALRQYIVLLVDRLKYVLNHLDDENITQVSAGKIARRMGTMAEALGESGTDNERVRQMVRELTMTTFKSAAIDWRNMQGFTAAVEAVAAEYENEALAGTVADNTLAIAQQGVQLTALAEALEDAAGRIHTYSLEGNTLKDETGAALGAVDFAGVNRRVDTLADRVHSYSLEDNVLKDETGAALGAVDLSALEARIAAIEERLVGM